MSLKFDFCSIEILMRRKMNRYVMQLMLNMSMPSDFNYMRATKIIS